MCIDKSRFIHAYGPKKKVLIMPTNYTIKLIEKTAKLKVKKISNIKNIYLRPKSGLSISCLSLIILVLTFLV